MRHVPISGFANFAKNITLISWLFQSKRNLMTCCEREREREKKRVYVREGVATKLHIPSNYVQKYITSSASKEYMKVDGYVKHSNY